MKNAAILITLTVLAYSWEGWSQSEPNIKALTPAAKSNIMVKVGGLIRTPNKGASICIVNVQKKIPLSTISLKVEEMKSVLHLPFLIVEEPDVDVVKLTEGVLKGTNVAVVVAVYDAPSQPDILIAPDARWALVNVARLDSGKADREIQESRFGKQLWRGLSGVLGVGYLNNSDSLLHPIKKLEDLDGITNKTPSMDLCNEFIVQATRFGAQRSQTTTYRKACEEGWAPMPTNSFQKAIWEEVKSKKLTAKEKK